MERYFPATEVAKALGVTKEEVEAIANREGWKVLTFDNDRILKGKTGFHGRLTDLIKILTDTEQLTLESISEAFLLQRKAFKFLHQKGLLREFFYGVNLNDLPVFRSKRNRGPKRETSS